VNSPKTYSMFDDSKFGVVLLGLLKKNEKPYTLFIEYANAAAAKLWDTVPETLIGVTLHDFGRDLDGRLLDAYQEVLINKRKQAIYDYSTSRDRHLKLDISYYDENLVVCHISEVDLDPGMTFTPDTKGKNRPLSAMEKAVVDITKIFAVFDTESYSLDNENDYIVFSDIKSRKIIRIVTAENNGELSKFALDCEGKSCYAVTQNRTTPCPFCSDRALRRDRFHVWQHHNKTLKKDYLHRTKIVKWDGQFVRMDLAQDITDEERKAVILAEVIEGLSLWNECMSYLSGAMQLEDAIYLVAESLGEFYEATACSVILYGSTVRAARWNAGDKAVPIAAVFAEPTSEALKQWGISMKRNAHTLISDATDERIPELLRKFFRQKEIRSTQLTPIFVGDHFRGIITLNNVAKNKTQAYLVDMVAQPIAHALRQTEMQDRMTQLRFRDLLTGHLNFDGFKYCAAKLIKENPQKQYALWYLDVRRFTYINNTFGYETGDKVLQYWSDAISNNVRPGETFCRISADTFAFLCCFKDFADLHDRFEWMNKEFGNHPTLKQKRIMPELAAGIYLLEEADREEPDINSMLDMANIAHKSVKKLSGKRMAIYDELIKERQFRELVINQNLEAGLENNEFYIVLQPQYNYRKSEIIGAEALVRWEHPTLGFVPPSEFIPLLEQAGLVEKLDSYVWEEACKLLRYLLENKDSLSVVPISVNISRTDICLPDIVETLSSLVKKYDVSPAMLKLEITESAYIDDSTKLISVVDELRNRGFTVQMDDFGTGYSSLTVLKEVSVDVLKLDMRFLVTGNDKDGRGGNILSSIVRMAHWINLPVLAEGVETKEEAEHLKSIGCEMMQGYYFSRPIPVKEFKNLLKNAKTGEALKRLSKDDSLNTAEFLSTTTATSFLFNNCVGGACLLELYGNDFEALAFNDEFAEVVGVSRETCEQNRLHMMALCNEEDRAGVIASFYEAIEKGSSLVYGRPNREDGTDRWIRNVNHFIATRNGRHMLFMIIEDVTEAYLSEFTIAEAKDRFEGFETLMMGGFYRYPIDSAGSGYDFASDGLANLLGYSRETFEQKFKNSFVELIYEEDREKVMRIIDEDQETGIISRHNIRLVTASGELLNVLAERCIVADRNGRKWCYGHLVETK